MPLHKAVFAANSRVFEVFADTLCCGAVRGDGLAAMEKPARENDDENGLCGSLTR